MRHPGEEELIRFINGQSEPEESERIVSHLARCPACRRERRELSVFIQALGQVLAERILPPKAVKTVAMH